MLLDVFFFFNKMFFLHECFNSHVFRECFFLCFYGFWNGLQLIPTHRLFTLKKMPSTSCAISRKVAAQAFDVVVVDLAPQ